MKALTNYRYYVLFVLTFIAVIGIFSEPEPELDAARWFTVFIISKTVGFAAGYLAYRLMAYWEKQGKIQVSDDEEI